MDSCNTITNDIPASYKITGEKHGPVLLMCNDPGPERLFKSTLQSRCGVQASGSWKTLTANPLWLYEAPLPLDGMIKGERNATLRLLFRSRNTPAAYRGVSVPHS